MEQQDGTPDGDLRQQIEALRADRDAALAQKAALAEILVAINASAGDSKPVFDLILEKAHLLCGAEVGSLGTFDGQYFRKVARHGYNTAIDVVLNQPYPAGTEHAPLLRGETLHVHDAFTYPWPEDARAHSIAYFIKGGLRTWLEVPMFKDGRLIGTLSGFRRQARPFSEREISLLESFSTQAVLAMENARLITEQREALEQQTATAEVLAVINASPGNLAPVFDSMLEKAMRLCEAAFGTLFIRDGKIFRSVAARGVPAAYAEFRAKTIMTPRPDSLLRKIMETKSVLHVLDIIDSEYYRGGTVNLRAVADLGGARTILHVPLMKDSEVLGVIVVYRQEVRAFTDKQISLLENFAAQAVIAMENASLITEQREALEQQTATAEVLGVINASPGNLAPVFDAILDKAMRVCGVAFGSLNTWDGDLVRNVANRGLPPALAEWQDRNPVRKAGAAALRSIETKRSQQLLDTMEEDGYKSGQPAPRAVVDLGGARTSLFVPLIKDESTLGFLHLFRQEVRAFTDKEIVLLENFAAQAVIAMENARLITETREALEQQTATTEVLRAINANPGTLAPVFETILERAHVLCGANSGALNIYDGTELRAVATRGYSEETAALIARGYRPSRFHDALLRGECIHMPDTAAYPWTVATESQRLYFEQSGLRAILMVPLRSDAGILGCISIARRAAGHYSDKQVTLLENFAAQAVIAMENARLITETREALEQQTATAEVLGVINASPGNLAPVFDTMLEKAMRLCGVAFGLLYVWDGEQRRAVAARGLPPAFAEYVSNHPATGNIPPLARRMIEARRTLQIPDSQDGEGYRAGHEAPRALVDLGGARTTLQVPLLKEDTVLGYFSLYRQEVRAFTDKQIGLLENFAAQAVIAMENARLITETREALEQQTATAEVLGVINASPGNLAPVFEAILEKGLRLVEAAFGTLWVHEGDHMHAVASHGLPAALAEFRARNPVLPKLPSSRQMDFTRRAVQAPDVREGEGYLSGHPGSRAVADLGGARTVLAVPLIRESDVIGTIQIYRQEVRPFTDGQIALLESFAAQAVIAMENARLITETREALEQQTATAEVLGVINASPGDLQPVFDAILEKSLRICRSAFGSLAIIEGESIRQVASQGVTAALAEYRAKQPTGQLSPNMLQLSETKRPVHQLDIREGVGYRSGHPAPRAVADLGGARTLLLVPLVKDQAVVGAIQIYRQEVRAFTDKEIALIENFAAQAVIAMENARLLNEIRAARDEAETTLENLRHTQDRLVQTEKMASLGQLTAGIAHEIKNPLNFVNNFSDLSIELLDELNEAVAPGKIDLPATTRAEIDDLTTTLQSNLRKIVEHGKRADSIVKNMLLHSRSGTSERRAVDLNTTAEEALNLAYHGARAETQGFNITLERDFDPSVGQVDLYPQEISRVLVNLINNGFYAAHKRAQLDPAVEPTLRLSTKNLGDAVEIRVRDNGTGIPPDVREKIFEPFFTTKPAGQGTGLGLSLSFDIVVKQHGGQLGVASETGVFTEFTVTLPRRLPENEGSQT